MPSKILEVVVHGTDSLASAKVEVTKAGKRAGYDVQDTVAAQWQPTLFGWVDAIVRLRVRKEAS